MKNTTINRAAHDLVENSQVTARTGELLEEGRKRHDITVDSLTEQLQDAYGLTMQTSHTAAVGATWALAINYTGWISLLRKSRKTFSRRPSSVWLIIRNRWESRVPTHYDQVAKCKKCGPVWSWFSGEVEACPWCCVKRQKAVLLPRPHPIQCIDSLYFRRTDHPHLGHCAVGEPEDLGGLWDTHPRECGNYHGVIS